jgi:hypothetical protein
VRHTTLGFAQAELKQQPFNDGKFYGQASNRNTDAKPWALYATRNERHLKQKRYDKEYNSLRAFNNRVILFL